MWLEAHPLLAEVRRGGAAGRRGPDRTTAPSPHDAHPAGIQVDLAVGLLGTPGIVSGHHDQHPGSGLVREQRHDALPGLGSHLERLREGG